MKLSAACGRRISSLQRRAHSFFPRPLWERARVRGIQRTEAPLPQSSPVEGEEVKRGFGLALVLMTITLTGSWPGEVYAADNAVSVLSYPDRPAKLPLWLAQDAGLFGKYGLKVDIKAPKSGEDLVERIGRDEAQIYVATANWIVSGIGDGKDLVFFANTGYSVLKLVARPDIARPQDLRGKKVGTGEPNSSQDRITRQALQRLGLNPDRDVTLVPFGSRSIQRLNALLKGEIDATTSNEDNLFELERRGEMSKVRVLADNESLKLFIGAGVRSFAGGSYLRPLFECQRSHVAGVHVPNLRSRRDSRASLSQVGQRRPRHRRIQRQAWPQRKARARYHRSKSSEGARD